MFLTFILIFLNFFILGVGSENYMNVQECLFFYFFWLRAMTRKLLDLTELTVMPPPGLQI